MILDVARQFLSIPTEVDTWDFMYENPVNFIWSENFHPNDWNNYVGNTPENKVDLTRVENVGVYFTYQNLSSKVNLVGDRDDDLRAVHCLSQLVKYDSEIRFCVDSYHFVRDKAFFALPPKDWSLLELEFGIHAVAYRFLKISSNLEQFFDEAFSDENNRSYSSGRRVDGKRSSVGSFFPRFDRAKADWVNVQNNDESFNVTVIDSLINAAIKSDEVAIYFKESSNEVEKFLIQKENAANFVSTIKAGTEVAFTNEKLDELVFIEVNGVAAIWQKAKIKVTEKTIKLQKPWWKVW